MNEKVIISIRLNMNKLTEIDKLATEINISRNELINQCIEYALNNINFDEQEKVQKIAI